MARAFPSVTDADEILMGHEDAGTISSCRNALAAQATGEWLCFLDADDELGPGFLEAMRAARARMKAKQHLHTMLLTPAVVRVRKHQDTTPFFHPSIDLAQANWLVIGTLIQRRLFEKIGGFQNYPHGLEDWALWSSAYRAGAKVIKVPEAIYRWYPNRASKHQRLMRSHHHPYWHQKVGHTIWPERFEAPTDEENARQTLLSGGRISSRIRMKVA